MKVDIEMPEMGESIAEGTVAKWLKKEGDSVERDEALLEITTDKIDSEIPSPQQGILAEILVEEGETVEVGTVLARLQTDQEGGDEKPSRAKKDEGGEKREKEGEISETTKAEPEDEEAEERPPKKLSPVARNIASKEGISEEELLDIEGSGQGGRITKSDLVSFLEEKEREPSRKELKSSEREVAEAKEGYDEERVEVIEMSTMRKTIADRMVSSKRISPHTYTVAEVDMTRIVSFRESVKRRFQEEEGFKLTYTPFILHATVQAIKAHPLINSSVEGERIIRKDYINLGVAVAIDSGLLVPVIKGADERNLLGLARAASILAERALTKKLKPEDVQGGTFTVTNPGVFGNIFGLPIINQPQLGILGVGAIKKRPVVVDDDAIGIRSMMLLSLSYDHRVVDGALAARFLQEIRKILENYDTDHAL